MHTIFLFSRAKIQQSVLFSQSLYFITRAGSNTNCWFDKREENLSESSKNVVEFTTAICQIGPAANLSIWDVINSWGIVSDRVLSEVGQDKDSYLST